MQRLRFRTQILSSAIAFLIFLAMGLVGARQSYLQPGDPFVQLDSGELIKRTPYDAQLRFWLEMSFCLIFCGIAITMLVSTLRGYLFEVRGAEFSQRFEVGDLDKILRIGPFSDPYPKGLEVQFRCEPAWKPRQSFQLNPPPIPLATYHVKLLGCENGHEVTLHEQKIRHIESGGEGGSFRPTWKRGTLSVERDFPFYFLEIGTSVSPPPAQWPQITKRGKGKSLATKPSVALTVRVNLALRWEDCKAWRANPVDFSGSALLQVI